MSTDDQDELLSRDWGQLWGELEDAPPLAKRPASSQITLRLPEGFRARVRRVAQSRGLPYHSLARSWIVEGLDGSEPVEDSRQTVPQPEQLNLRVDPELLDRLKRRAHELRRPYHALARDLIESALVQDERRLGSKTPGLKDLMVLLLHTKDAEGREAVRGITRMQKLLFVLEQTLAPGRESFRAYNYGPFSDGVNDAAEALRIAGFLAGSHRRRKGPPSFAEMMQSAKAAPPSESDGPQEFALSEEGHEAAERLRHSNPSFENLFENVRRIRTEWDTPDLVERVYEQWPEQTTKSLIRDEVAERRRRREGK